jgi:hypothetical protein
VGSNLSPTRVEHLAPPAVMDTGQPGSMPTRGQPLTQMVTIDDAMPFRILISNDAKVSIMSLQVFLTLQIPISSLTPTSPVRGPNNDVMETHGSIILTIALGAIDDFEALWSISS